MISRKRDVLCWKACTDQYSFHFVGLAIKYITTLVVKTYFCKFSEYSLFLDKQAFKEKLLTLKATFPSCKVVHLK